MDKELTIKCNVNDKSKATLVFECANCSENDFANMLREILIHVNTNDFIRKKVLLLVLQDVVNEI